MTDIRKPFLKSFTVKELMQFIDYYIEHKEMLHVPGHPWEVCDLVARFLGFGYSRQWSEDETAILTKNYPPLGAKKTSELLLMRTAYDCKLKADGLGLHTNVKFTQTPHHVSWSLYELDILSRYYSIIGPKVMALLPGRTDTACGTMAKKMKIHDQSAGPWSEKELEILKNYYSEMGLDIGILLPGRSSAAIRTMAGRTEGTSQSRKWTPEEDEIIRVHFPQMGPSVASLFEGRRTKSACYQRAVFLGVQPPVENQKWSENELEILKKHYPSLGIKVMALLPGRTESACISRARKLNLTASCKTPRRGKKWTDDELAILKEFCPKVGAAGVHKLLPHRSVNACENMALKLGVSAQKLKWTDAEIEILRENYPKLGKAVAELLPGRTAMTCQAKASALGLLVEGHFWTDEEDAIIKEYYPREGQAVSQRLLNRSESSCVHRACKLGLCRIKSTDAAVSKVKESLDDNWSIVKLSPDTDDAAGNQTMEENTVLARIETPQSGDDIDEEQQEEPSPMQFGSMHM